MSERMIWPNWCGANIVASGLKSGTLLFQIITMRQYTRTVGASRIAPLAGGVADQIQGPTNELEQAIV